MSKRKEYNRDTCSNCYNNGNNGTGHLAEYCAYKGGPYENRVKDAMAAARANAKRGRTQRQPARQQTRPAAKPPPQPTTAATSAPRIKALEEKVSQLTAYVNNLATALTAATTTIAGLQRQQHPPPALQQQQRPPPELQQQLHPRQTLSKESLVQFYQQHDPSRIAKVDDFLQKYPVRNIVAALTKKYGVAPVTTAHSQSSLQPTYVDNLNHFLGSDDALR